jgi:hypothetical protein
VIWYKEKERRKRKGEKEKKTTKEKKSKKERVSRLVAISTHLSTPSPSSLPTTPHVLGIIFLIPSPHATVPHTSSGSSQTTASAPSKLAPEVDPAPELDPAAELDPSPAVLGLSLTNASFSSSLNLSLSFSSNMLTNRSLY